MAHVSYHVDDEGLMTIYYGELTLFELSACGNMTDQEIDALLEEAIPESSSLYASLVQEDEDDTTIKTHEFIES